MRWAETAFVVGTLAGVISCAEVPAPESTDSVRLVWYRSEATETWPQARSGLDWTLSQLGATPPEGGGAQIEIATGSERVEFVLDVATLGLSVEGQDVLAEVAAELAADEPGADVGRFLMRSLQEPWRYYAMTGACSSRSEWEAKEQNVPLAYAVTTSQLSAGHRRVLLNAAPESIDAIAFLAEEGSGSLVDGDFVVGESEVVDVMTNGQFRYAVYDEAGGLIPAGKTSPSGTPGKCSWCHEWHIQPGTPENQSASGYLSYAEFMIERDAAQARIQAHREALATSVDYETYEVHAYAERLVEGFLFPDAARVAAEWQVPVATVVSTLGEGDLGQPDFGWTNRYARADVDAASPTAPSVTSLPSARELADDDVPVSAPAPSCDGAR